MSSELFVFDNSFLSDPFTDLNYHIPIENLFHENGCVFIQEKEEILCFDKTTCSPPSVQLESLLISHLRNGEYSGLEVKTEGSQINFESFSGNECSFIPQSYDGLDETAVKFMQRSYSSHSFDNRQDFSFIPQFDSILESQHLQNQPEKTISSGQLRRVCSTGDLQKMKMKINIPSRSMLSSSAEKSFVGGRYNTEERKERIDRYRAKRTQRNFNKTIKYACRKTLADNRQRVRGRFARNDEAGEIPKTSTLNGYEDDQYDIWIDGFHEDEESRITQRGSIGLHI